MKNITKIIATPEQMYQYGYECASIYPKILLNGELGAGKTTFTK